MPVNRRGASWQAQVNHKGQRHRKDFATETEAQKWHDETLQILKSGGSLLSEGRVPRTMADLIDYVWENHYRHIKSGPIVKYFLNALRDRSGAILITSYGKYEIDRLVTSLRTEGASDSTLNHKLAYVSKLLQTAVDLDIIPKKPKLPRFKTAQHRTRIVEPHEERELLGFFELRGDTAMVDAVIIGLDTGLRRGEIAKLDATNVDGKMLRMHGDQTKTMQARSIPMTPRVHSVLTRRVEARPNGKLLGLTVRNINDRWNEARAHMGLSDDEWFTPHAMRHTFCTRLGRLGYNAQTIQAMSGHETLEVLKRYTHMDEVTLAAAVERLANHFTLEEVA
jgi:integrase